MLGAAVLDDIIGVVLLPQLYEFSNSGGVSLANTGKVLAFIALFMVLAPFAASSPKARFPAFCPPRCYRCCCFSRGCHTRWALRNYRAGSPLDER